VDALWANPLEGTGAFGKNRVGKNISFGDLNQSGGVVDKRYSDFITVQFRWNFCDGILFNRGRPIFSCTRKLPFEEF
jgi:hypothetical protein